VHLYRPSADVLCMFAPPGTPKDQLQQSRPLVAVVPFPDPDPSTPRTLKAARHRLVGNPHLYPGPTTWGRDAFIALYDDGPAYAFSHKLMTLVVPGGSDVLVRRADGPPALADDARVPGPT
jgi:hypothetical protein